jgi:hypothetical protein
MGICMYIGALRFLYNIIISHDTICRLEAALYDLICALFVLSYL